MNIMTVIAHPNPRSFSHAILHQFDAGLKEAGHTNDIVDLYAIRFDPVFRTKDFASYIHDSMPLDMLEQMDLMKSIMDYCGVKKVEHVYFYGADVSTPETRRGWLDQAYRLGRDFTA